MYDREDSGVRKRRWDRPSVIALLVAVILLPGCLGSSDEADSVDETGPSPTPPAKDSQGALGAPKRLVDRCNWQTAKDAGEAAIRKAFVDRESGDVRLLLADDTIRPGGILQVAVANDSSRAVRYGTFSHVETEQGEEVRIKGPYGFPAIGLSASPGSVGPCVSLPVPSATAAGKYVAVLDDISLPGDEMGEVSASFEVAGAPIRNPEWEVRLREAARDNRGSP